MTIDDDRRADISGEKPSPLGDTAELFPGVALQRPNRALLAALTAADSRIRYVEGNAMIASSRDNPEDAFNAAHRNELEFRISRDFADVRDPLHVRGIVVSLRDEFPCFPQSPYRYYKHFATSLEPVDNVHTILAKGHEGSEVGRTDAFENRQLGMFAWRYMHRHTLETVTRLTEKGERHRSDNLFPGMIVYSHATMRNWNETEPQQRIAALYITDRVIDRRQPRQRPVRY